MKEKSKYKIYLDTTDRKISKISLFKIEKNREAEVARKEGQVDLVYSIGELLGEAGLSINDIETVGYNQGPGSFTGLRMSAAVSNVSNWLLGKKDLKELEYPKYGSEPKITPPKKFKI